MTSLTAFSTLGGFALGGAAGDLFLSRSLAPAHFDPLTGPDPFQSRFCRADSGDDQTGGDETPEKVARRAAERIQEEVLGLLRKWPSRRIFAEMDADALRDAWRTSENRDDPKHAAHGARLLTGLLMLEEGLQAFFEALWQVPDEKVRSAGLEALRNRFLNFEESLEVIPRDDVLTAEREAADQMLACLRSVFNEDVDDDNDVPKEEHPLLRDLKEAEDDALGGLFRIEFSEQLKDPDE